VRTSVLSLSSDEEAGRYLCRLLVEELCFAVGGVTNLNLYAKTWPDQDDLVRDQDKVSMEAALFALLAKRVGSDFSKFIDVRITELINVLLPELCNARVVNSIDQDPHSVWRLGIGYLLFREITNPDTELEHALNRASATRQTDVRELSPFKEMERQWIRSLRGEADDRQLNAACILSTAGRDAHPIYMNRMDGYALTHAIFYLTDFGRKAIPHQYFDNLDEKLDAAIAWTLATRDYDLLIEFLLSAIMSGNTKSPYCLAPAFRQTPGVL
jgi:hypothetical protein